LGAEMSRIEGTGVGLSIVRRRVENMGGTLGVESKPGKGSTFWVELPSPQGAVAGVSAEPVPQHEG
jgi:signal transduction histidine kinase